MVEGGFNFRKWKINLLELERVIVELESVIGLNGVLCDNKEDDEFYVKLNF